MSSSDIQDLSSVIDNVIAVGSITETALDNLMTTVDSVQESSTRDELAKGDTGESFRNSTVAISVVVAEEAEEEILITKKSMG